MLRSQMDERHSIQKHIARVLMVTADSAPVETDNVTIVRTAQQLQDAVIAGTPHIEIQVCFHYYLQTGKHLGLASGCISLKVLVLVQLCYSKDCGESFS